MDQALFTAREIIRQSSSAAHRPLVESFFDEVSSAVSYVVSAPDTKDCLIIDSVLGFDPATGRTDKRMANAIIDYVRGRHLSPQWILETHIHADHLSAAGYLQRCLGGRLGIGRHVIESQRLFGKLFALESISEGDGFDRLFDDGECFSLGAIGAAILHVPGHTPADIAYVIGDAVFTGDTLMMPDYGTARTDFPGGDAAQLYHSIRRLFQLPDETRLYLCHDYKAPGRDTYSWCTTIGTQRRQNVQMNEATSEADFVALRKARDTALTLPKLMLPAVQVNIMGGRLPKPSANGVSYLKIPIDLF